MSALGWLGVAAAALAFVGWCWLMREAIRDMRRRRREMDAAFDRIFAAMRDIDRNDPGVRP